MSSAQQHPKFLMQVKREQPVPKLISINDFGSSGQPTHKKQQFSKSNNPKSQQKPPKHFSNDSRQQNYVQASRSKGFHASQSQVNYNTFTSSNGQNVSIVHNEPVNPSMFYTTARKQLPVTEARNYRLEVIQLEKLLQIQRQQKLQLQQIIKQLTVQSEKLKEVNDHIVDRLKDLERNFVEEKANQEKEQDQRVKKVISQVYCDVQEFVRAQIQTLTHKLKGERMSPLLEKKLQLFMESILQINQNTVEMFKISQKRYTFTSDPLAPFMTEGYSNEKENMTASDFSRRVNFLFDSKSKNESFMSRSSYRGDKSSPARSGKRLINNVYISSNKKPSPSRLLFDTGNKQDSRSREKNQSILEENYLEENQMETFRDNFQRQKMDKIPADHIQFINPFSSNQFGTGSRNSRMKTVEDSDIGRRQYFETSNYDENNFHIKEYTPNKRKKIFGEGPGRSKSKRYDTTNSHW